MLMTFDLNEVQEYANDLTRRMEECRNGEGNRCATLDDAVSHHARLARELIGQIRDWADKVFYGEVAFDQGVESILLDQAARLLGRIRVLNRRAEPMLDACFEFDKWNLLQSMTNRLDRLVAHWISPSRAVSPSARIRIPIDSPRGRAIAERLAALPPLPADWEPEDEEQRKFYAMVKGRAHS